MTWMNLKTIVLNKGNLILKTTEYMISDSIYITFYKSKLITGGKEHWSDKHVNYFVIDFYFDFLGVPIQTLSNHVLLYHSLLPVHYTTVRPLKWANINYLFGFILY